MSGLVGDKGGRLEGKDAGDRGRCSSSSLRSTCNISCRISIEKHRGYRGELAGESPGEEQVLAWYVASSSSDGTTDAGSCDLRSRR